MLPQLHWDGYCTIAGWFENDQGWQWHADQAVVPAYADVDAIPEINDPGISMWDGKVGHKLVIKPGTRQATEATITMNDKNGQSREVTLTPKLLFRLKGIGYMHPEWGHGQWKGDLAMAGEVWNCDEVDPLALENIHIQQVVEARCGDEVGYGVLEQLHIGPYSPYGFEDWFDGAK